MNGMGLKTYKKKRSFPSTPEPPPAAASPSDRLNFVVQKHAATSLHYDLRLQMEGVLKSWAIPKGPSMAPLSKKLAMMVEDHPFDYKDFEGVIPEGNYGAGSVIVWDRGFYHHPDDPGGRNSETLLMDGLKKGHIKFVLEGQKLKGQFDLVKTGMQKNSWLLIKKKDDFSAREDVLKKNRSVVSNETLEEVAAESEEHLSPSRIDRMRLREAEELDDLSDAPQTAMPHCIKPMLATLVKAPFDDPGWFYEMKWDGYRAIAEIRGGGVDLYSRNALALTKKYSAVVQALKKFEFDAMLDGEIIVADDEGRPDFQMLQDYQKSRKGYLIYYVFDVLHFRGHDLTGLPLARRKDILKKILPSVPNVKISDHIVKDGKAFFHVVEEKGLEGVVAKNSQSLYRMGKRSRDWLKIKTHLTQEGVIAGFTEPRGSRKDFGSLVLGAYEDGELVFIGHAGGGLSARKLQDIRARLTPLIQEASPFKAPPKTNAPVTWVKPQLVCEVIFHGWTTDGLMRQPLFLRLREDKNADEVSPEKAAGAPGETSEEGQSAKKGRIRPKRSGRRI